VKKTFLEGLLVAVVGVAVGFTANALSPGGLKLSRNYFPGGTAPRPASTATTGHTAPQATNAAATTSSAEAHLKQMGLEVVTSAQAEVLFHDPRTQQELILFIDARDTQHYEAGHIPGAIQFDHYHPEQYAAVVMPACQQAQQIIVYCKGGDCEDSEHAAVMLRDSMGVAKEKLFVYAGGITDWEAHQRPIEIGARKSGQLKANK
jgi:rhodanese-related sulfurtransferase